MIGNADIGESKTQRCCERLCATSHLSCDTSVVTFSNHTSYKNDGYVSLSKCVFVVEVLIHPKDTHDTPVETDGPPEPRMDSNMENKKRNMLF